MFEEQSELELVNFKSVLWEKSQQQNLSLRGYVIYIWLEDAEHISMQLKVKVNSCKAPSPLEIELRIL